MPDFAAYLPSTYSPDRAWNLLIGFHPGARGRAIVETYRAAAEQYGYIVAGSNTSRNGPWAISMASVSAMSADLGQRFSIDVNRLYLTGLSGGARVALQVALTNKSIAGVIASSAGYPDNKPRTSVSFAVFSTAGSDDFNYVEMRQLDRKLTSPHRLAIFTGGHTLPPDTVAIDAIEWMELQAMKSGRRAKDVALINGCSKSGRDCSRPPTATGDGAPARRIVEDFGGLRDVSAKRRGPRSCRASPRSRRCWRASARPMMPKCGCSTTSSNWRRACARRTATAPASGACAISCCATSAPPRPRSVHPNGARRDVCCVP